MYQLVVIAVVAAAALLGTVVGGLALLKVLGLVTTDNTVMAATVAFVGVLVAEVLTFLLGVLKPILENREQTRRDAAEKRLEHEASTKAIGLLSYSNGQESPPNQQSAAVAMLSSLGQVDLSLALLRQMWPQNRILDSTAMWLINKGLMSGKEAVQNEAIDLLVENIDRAISSSGYILWPDCLKYYKYEDRPSIQIYVRRRALHAIMLLILSKPFSYWQHRHLLFVIHLLVLLLKTEPANSDVRSDSALGLRRLLDLQAVQLRPSTTILSERVSERSIREAIEESVGTLGIAAPTEPMAEIIKAIEAWHAGTFHQLEHTASAANENTLELDGHRLWLNCRVEHYACDRWVPGQLAWQPAGNLQLVFQTEDGSTKMVDLSKDYFRLPDSRNVFAEEDVDGEGVHEDDVNDEEDDDEHVPDVEALPKNPADQGQNGPQQAGE